MKIGQVMCLGYILLPIEGQGHRSKGQRSRGENEVILGHFRLKKKLGSHRSEFGSAILDLGPLNKYKKTQEIKF